MAISLVNNLSMNRSDTAVADDVWTATSATLSDFQGAGGMGTLIATATASDSAALEFTTGIDGTYTTYLFALNDIQPASAVALHIRFYVGGSLDSSSNYDYVCRAASTDGSLYINSGQNSGFMNMNYSAMDTDTEETQFSNVWLSNPASTVSYQKIMWQNHNITSNIGYAEFGCGTLRTSATTATTGIKFYGASGNITSGTIRMYGLKSS